MIFFGRLPMDEEFLAKTWSLFYEMIEDPSSMGVKHSTEILSSVRNGRLDPNQENFNLYGYEFRCNQRDNITASKNAKRFKPLVQGGDTDEEGGGDRRGVVDSETLVNPSLSDAFESTTNNMYLRESLRDLVKSRVAWMLEEGVDVFQSLVSSLAGSSSATEVLVEVCRSSDAVKEVVTGLLEASEKDTLLGILEEEMVKSNNEIARLVAGKTKVEMRR